jgi:hypothetical protein
MRKPIPTRWVWVYTGVWVWVWMLIPRGIPTLIPNYTMRTIMHVVWSLVHAGARGQGENDTRDGS